MQLAPMISIPPDITIRNGGTRCDMLNGPCACGAWHAINDISHIDDVRKAYVYFLIVEKDNGKNRV